MGAAMDHKFSLDQEVVFTPSIGEVLTVPTRGRVTRQLPREGANYQYYVRIESDGPERRARESQLRAISA